MPRPRIANTSLRLKPEIRAVGIHKSFGTTHVLEGIDLEIRQGEIVAIVGRSGSGKTVLMDHLVGLMRPDEGKVLVADHSMGDGVMVNLAELDQDELDRVRVHWAVVFQTNALFSGSVYENCAFWLREHTRLSEKKIEQRVREAVREASLDVDDVLEKNRDELSGGMAKRVAIARALAMDPQVLFYDEPTTGLDPVVAGEIHELIYAVHNRPHSSGDARTTVIVTHDRDLLRRIRPRVVMLDGGKVCFDGPYEKFETTDCEPAQKYLQIMPELQAQSVAG